MQHVFAYFMGKKLTIWAVSFKLTTLSGPYRGGAILGVIGQTACEMRDQQSLVAMALGGQTGDLVGSMSNPPTQIEPGTRIILIRHGQPAIALRPRTGHHGFRDYIDAYEAAGLDPASLPPRELADLVREVTEIFTSGRPRSDQSAKALAPHAALIVDPLFAEAPLASPRIPLLQMRVPTWAVMARILWHVGYHPGIEDYRKARHRAAEAADILIAKAHKQKASALVAHGYFNAMIGRQLRQRGFVRTGSHRVRYWNAVIYDWKPGGKIS
jgi:broad specificity phosphatase PhoE